MFLGPGAFLGPNAWFGNPSPPPTTTGAMRAGARGSAMFDLGDAVLLATEVLDPAGALTAGGTVVCTIGQPDGTTATATVTSPSTGRYEAVFLPTMPGRHTERWTSSSPATARSDMFDVRPATPAYIVSLADAKKHLNMDAASTTDDEELRGFIEACTEVVEELAQEVIVRRTVVERRELHGRSTFALHSVPVISLTAVTDPLGGPSWSPSDFQVDPATGIVDVLAGATAPWGLTQLVYVAGYQVIPARYTRAALVILRHLWESQRGALGARQRNLLGGGTEEMMAVAGWSVPRAASDLIGPAMPSIA